jgi:2-oxo-4-hydroxy-4-carboxy-5-ureidoimidazoline decarboxylase
MNVSDGDGLARWNGLPAADAERDLLGCCAAPDWARAVAALRPFPSVAALTATARRLLADLPWSQVAQALAAHPRIGARIAAAGREADWSRREQSGAADADAATADALVAANRAYEERFGHVFLIFATGRTAGDMLAAARERLAHPPDTEREVVRGELARITTLRLERLVA